MTADTHTLRAAILRTLHVEPAGSSALHRRLGRHAPRIIDATVAALTAEGLVALKWSRWRLTSAGRAALPGVTMDITHEQLTQDALMRFDPAFGTERPYPSHAAQWREWHGHMAWLFNPWTGGRRHPADIGSDPFGYLIAPQEK